MSQYDQQSERGETNGHGPAPLLSARDALAPYLAATEVGPFTKLSISLPEPLITVVREVSAETGVGVSGVIAASLRRFLDELEQARIDEALAADAAENLDWSRAAAPGDALLLRDLEW